MYISMHFSLLSLLRFAILYSMYTLTRIEVYLKEVSLASSSQQLYFVLQWVLESVLLEPFQ